MKDNVQEKFDDLAAGYLDNYRQPQSILDLEKTRRMELLVEYAEQYRPASVLDAGCGPGFVLKELRERFVHLDRLVGVDFSRSMLEQANVNNSRSIPLVNCDVETLPLRPATFDLVFALGVLGYLGDDRRFFSAVSGLLRPGGHFIFTYPNQRCFNRRLLKFARNLRSFGNRREGHAAAVPIRRAAVAQIATECGLELTVQRFITFGNGRIAFPWSASMNRKMEAWLDGTAAAEHLGWSGFCVARKKPLERR